MFLPIKSILLLVPLSLLSFHLLLVAAAGHDNGIRGYSIQFVGRHAT